MQPNNKLPLAMAFLISSATLSPFDQPVVQERTITVTGCIERDAAATTPIYKVIVPQPDGASVIYQLNAPGSSAIPSAVGKTAEVSGAVTIEKRAGREIKVLTVKGFEVVADRCK
jgi:hypothetical protein